MVMKDIPVAHDQIDHRKHSSVIPGTDNRRTDILSKRTSRAVIGTDEG